MTLEKIAKTIKQSLAYVIAYGKHALATSWARSLRGSEQLEKHRKDPENTVHKYIRNADKRVALYLGELSASHALMVHHFVCLTQAGECSSGLSFPCPGHRLESFRVSSALLTAT